MPLLCGGMEIDMEQKQNTSSPRGGRRSRWSVIDTVILLLVLMAIGGIVYRAVSTVYRDEQAEGRDVYEVYFEVAETHRDVLAEIRGFDNIYLYENGMHLGTIGMTKDEESGESIVALTTVPVEGTELATALGCFVCAGSDEMNGGLLVEGTGRYLTRGGELTIRTDRVVLTVKITDIRKRS